MKKFLSLFILLNFIFVGLILKISSDKKRSIASQQDENESASELTPGQKRKIELIKSLVFTRTSSGVMLKTDNLQILCDSNTFVELKYKALNIAVSGQEPMISHKFSCDEIKKNATQEGLFTSIADIRSMHKSSLLKKDFSELRAQGIYSDEDLPNHWRLFEISIIGENDFNIFEVEINKFLGEKVFKFSL